MALRATWKGYLKVAQIVCPVALYTATSTSDRIAFNMVNRTTGHAVRRIYVDHETGDPVPKEEQLKGYEIGPDEYVVIEPEDIASVVPHNDKTLDVEGFIPCNALDDAYFDRPYYLAPAGRGALETFALLREGMKHQGVAAIAHAVLFRRARSVLIRAHAGGLVATTLSFDYEVRAARDVFADIAQTRAKPEMLKLAEHILATKAGAFKPEEFEDRYEDALGEMVKAKLAGRPLPRAKPAASAEVIDLMTALRQSAKQAKPTRARASPTKKAAAGSKAGKKATTRPAKAARLPKAS